MKRGSLCPRRTPGRLIYQIEKSVKLIGHPRRAEVRFRNASAAAESLNPQNLFTDLSLLDVDLYFRAPAINIFHHPLSRIDIPGRDVLLLNPIAHHL